jgi:hypothetical protein
MNAKKLYFYLFYKLYKFWDFVSFPKIWTDAKAVLTITVLELSFIYTTIIYYKLFINPNSHFGEGVAMIFLPTISIATINFYIFIYSDKSKEIVREFEKWPEKKNDFGTMIVWGVVIFIVGNLVFACNIPH